MKQKFMRRPKEKGYEFVMRIMRGATIRDEHLTARQVHKLVDQRGSRKMDLRQVQSSLYYAAKKTDKITIHKVKGKRKTYTYNHTLGELFGELNYSQDDSFFDEEDVVSAPDLFYEPSKTKVNLPWNNKEEPLIRFKHKKDAVKDFGDWNFIKHDKKEPRDAIVSTVKHEFTAEQLLESLEALNQDLHDNVIVAIFTALGKNNYSPFHHDFTKPQPRKTALMSWTFVDGNLVVKE